jgi:ADP-ribose pyrophosphatase
MENNPWKIEHSKKIYDNPWIRVTEHNVLNPKGGKGIYGVIHFKNLALGVIALDDELNTYLVGQYRFPLGRYSWEIPEGGGKLDVDPLESARRELLEETGLKARSWELIQKMDLSNSVSDECAYIYLARGLSQHDSHPEDTEELRVWKLPFEEAYRMVIDGRITDSLSVAGILRTKLILEKKV